MSLIPKARHLSLPYQTIVEAISDSENPIGSGGYGLVYRGQLSLSGKLTMVAIKKLDHKMGQGNKEFLTEIQLPSRYKHPNLVSLVGFCEKEHDRYLVYKYAENGSLGKYLKANEPCRLTWKQRIKICIDAACGLHYLHNPLLHKRNERVIHRDIKSANILLDQNWKAIIADLGLSVIGRANESTTFVIANPWGTRGYVDPDFMRTSFLTTECDVYSFGVVLLEVLCGRFCIISENGKQELLATRAKEYHRKGKLNLLVDPQLKNYMKSESMVQFSEIAIKCLRDQRTERPKMSLVLRELKDALETLEMEESKELREIEKALDLQELVEMLQMQELEKANGIHISSNSFQAVENASSPLHVARELVETSRSELEHKVRMEQPEVNRSLRDYKQFIYYSNEEMMKKPQGDVKYPTEEEACSILSRGVLMKLNNEVNIWFWITKLEWKKCFILAPRSLQYGNQRHNIKWIPSNESRTKKVLHLSPSEMITMHFDAPNAIFSKNTTYGCFLVYKILQRSHVVTLVTKLNDNLQLGKYRTHLDISDSPVDETKSIKREDGWLEFNLVNKSANISWIQPDEHQDELSTYFRPSGKSTKKFWFPSCVSDNNAHDTDISPTSHRFKKISISMNCDRNNQTPMLIVQGIEFRPM